MTQLTSQPRQPAQVTRNTQIGNITVEQIAICLGSNSDHLVGSIRGCFNCTPIYGGARLALAYDPDDYYVFLESSSSFSKHFNDICVITLGRTIGTTFPIAVNSSCECKYFI